MISIVTNIDRDHLGTYEGDFERLKHVFVEFLHHLPFYGLAIVCLDDEHVREILEDVARPILTYGEHEDADVKISDLEFNGRHTLFNVRLPERDDLLAIKLNFSGKHNALNATAAIALAWELGISNEDIQQALVEFEGINRRFQVTENVKIKQGTITHIDDYGHHPNEVKAALTAVKQGWPERRLVVAFQPHRYTRTKDLFEDFVAELSLADHLLLTEVYPAGEEPIKDADGRSLSGAIRARGQVNPVFIESINDLQIMIDEQLQDGYVLVTLGAGNIGQFAVEFLKLHNTDGASS
jgi:UDP-N-acetylmuramate--alanine ligase